jgi:hypothetical protein
MSTAPDSGLMSLCSSLNTGTSRTILLNEFGSRPTCMLLNSQGVSELGGHLRELERAAFLKPTDADGVWEFNMVERDIVYEVGRG